MSNKYEIERVVSISNYRNDYARIERIDNKLRTHIQEPEIKSFRDLVGFMNAGMISEIKIVTNIIHKGYLFRIDDDYFFTFDD